MNEHAPPEVRTFEVLLGNRARVETALVALAKRAARRHLPPLTWTWGKAHTEKERAPHPEYGWKVKHEADVARVPLHLPCGSTCYAGWTFLAALQHLDGENIVRAVPGAEVPTAYRSRGPVCDHCKHNRRRNDTYVLRHEDGRVMQVGSTCIGDFLGSDEAGKVAAQASMLAELRGLAEGACEGSCGPSADRTLAEYLPFVAWCVRVQGWVSRTMARERENTMATADWAWNYLTDPTGKARRQDGADPTPEDESLARDAEAWADGLTDAEVDSGKGDYLHNLRAVARTGLVVSRTAGIAASMVTAYQREVGRQRQQAERAARPVLDAYVGTVGERQTFRATLDFVTGFDTQYGYTTILKFVTVEGATLVWKASSTEMGRADVGTKYRVTGTVSKHEEYKGQKQTMLSRCKVVVDDGSPEPEKKLTRKRKPNVSQLGKVTDYSVGGRGDWPLVIVELDNGTTDGFYDDDELEGLP